MGFLRLERGELREERYSKDGESAKNIHYFFTRLGEYLACLRLMLRTRKRIGAIGTIRPQRFIDAGCALKAMAIGNWCAKVRSVVGADSVAMHFYNTR